MLRLWGHFSGGHICHSALSTFDRFEDITTLFLSEVLVHALNVPINMALEEGQRSGALAQHLVMEVLKAKFLPQGFLGVVTQLH